MKSSLEHKTIRPGSLSDYSFYYSNRTPPRSDAPAKPPLRLHVPWGKLLIIAVLAAAVTFGFMHSQSGPKNSSSSNSHAQAAKPADKPMTNSQAAAAPVDTHCDGNTLDRFIRVSITDRHLWACEGSKVAYSSPVITGNEQYDSTLTPPGTYQIYSKQHDVVLTGSDVTGSWRDPVSYWMPFLSNQYGIYGFHDATWRDPGQFGNVDPNSSDASHGCVELPIATSKWLYNWAQVGTTLTIES